MNKANKQESLEVIRECENSVQEFIKSIHKTTLPQNELKRIQKVNSFTYMCLIS